MNTQLQLFPPTQFPMLAVYAHTGSVEEAYREACKWFDRDTEALSIPWRRVGATVTGTSTRVVRFICERAE